MEREIARFHPTTDGCPSEEMKAAFARDGFLVIETFAAPAACEDLRRRMDGLIADFDPDSVRSVFAARGDQVHSADRYFRASGDRISFFFETGAFDAGGRLVKDKAAALNKVGHALHDLDPVFSRFCRDPRLAALARGLGQVDPGLMQSMYIFKPPFIGGEVDCHQDATFLYTEPQSCLGFWFALEDATLENGCLQALPGAHAAGLRQRYRYRDDDLALETLDTAPWPGGGRAALEVPGGTLIVLHGLLPHLSGPNRSARSRHAFSLHTIDRAAHWPADNWLRRGPDMPVRGFS